MSVDVQAHQALPPTARFVLMLFLSETHILAPNPVTAVNCTDNVSFAHKHRPG